MKTVSAFALLTALLGPGPATAEALRYPFPFQVPIFRKVVPEAARQDGSAGGVAFFYALPVRVGSTSLPALLDTGSIGLRVLPDMLRPRDIISSDGHPETETFGGSVVLDGVAARAPVAVGVPLGSPVTLQLIQRGSCASGTSTRQCTLAKDHLAQFRFCGQGRPGVGFPAIFGIRAQQPGPQSEVYNALNQTGHNRYVVDLPRTQSYTGSLLIDPNQLQTQPFVRLAHDMNAPNATVRGCLQNTDTGQGICGAMLFDSGAPTITVANQAQVALFPANAHVRIRFVDQSGATIQSSMTLGTESFVVGTQPYTNVSARQDTNMFYISLGQVPFMAFSVLIDAQAQTLAIRARPNAPPNVPIGSTGG